jgi:catechol 2,3-dioxygenase-like lactoylglutathione lyase family enzyme
MLSKQNVMATIAVRDLPKARQFYEDILGFEPVSFEDSEVVVYGSGQSRLVVYVSSFAGSNKATAATWVAGNEIDEIARDLKEKGVAFEHYDMPGMAREGDVHVGGGMRVAWFKDPDGNILAMANQ